MNEKKISLEKTSNFSVNAIHYQHPCFLLYKEINNSIQFTFVWEIYLQERIFQILKNQPLKV